MQTLRKFLILLTPKERRRAYLLFFMILIMALLDMIGVASILPFIAVLTNPEIVETNNILNKIFTYSNIFGVKNNQQFLFSLGLIVFILLVFSLFFKALTTYAQLRFVQMREYTISKRFVESYLHQPYSWFLNRNSADLGKTILSEVSGVVGRGMKPLMELIAKSMITFVLIILLIMTDPKLALSVGLSLGAAYGIIYKLTLSYLTKIGKERLKSNQLRFTAINEAFGAAKELKVGGLENVFINRFSNAAKINAQNQASAAVIGQLPRFALEAIAFGGILLVILYLISQKGSFNDSLPILSLYVFAGYRLLPALQQIYASFTQLSFISASLDDLSDDIQKLSIQFGENDNKIIHLNQNILLKDVTYKYPNASQVTLKNININIPAKTTVGLIGTTGSGKTTTVDIILGLLEPNKGVLEVDNQIITRHNSRSWQRSIGYVPQHIYLADDTVTANIAFGLDPKNINQQKVERVAKIANLHEFIINELPKNYQNIVGERGIRLSGGQRQRLGIARALYHDPQILILDEATSSLDNQTEQIVMNEINNLRKDITIIIIAHRLNTVKSCDIIYKFEKGEIVAKGRFEDIFN